MEKKNKKSRGILKNADRFTLSHGLKLFSAISIIGPALFLFGAGITYGLAHEEGRSKLKETSDYNNYSFEYRRVINENEFLTQEDKQNLTEESHVFDSYIEGNLDKPLVQAYIQETDKKSKTLSGALVTFGVSAMLAEVSMIAAGKVSIKEDADNRKNRTDLSEVGFTDDKEEYIDFDEENINLRT